MFYRVTLIYLIMYGEFNFNISDISINKTDNFSPTLVWNYKYVRSSQGLGRACGVSRLLLHIPLLGVQERDVRVRSLKRALGCWVTILLQHTPLQWERKNVATPGPNKLIKLVGSAGWSSLIVSKWGENVKNS